MPMDVKELFNYLRPDQIDRISQVSQTITRKAGELVYERGKKAFYTYVVLSGRVSLFYPVSDFQLIKIVELKPGNVFGSIAYLNMDLYHLDARCKEDSVILRMESKVLKKMMDDDLIMGYAIQSRLSEIYFMRYINAITTMKSTMMEMT